MISKEEQTRMLQEIASHLLSISEINQKLLANGETYVTTATANIGIGKPSFFVVTSHLDQMKANCGKANSYKKTVTLDNGVEFIDYAITKC